MQKITFYFLLITSFFTMSAQTYTSGDIILSNTTGLEMQVKLDITATEVTLTFTGPSDRWFAIGFGGSNMNSVQDAFLYDGTGNFDKKIIPYSNPETDASQDWNLVSDIISGSQREIIATRDLDTGDGFDYIFTHTDNTIPVIWARGNTASMTLAYHEGSNRGIASIPFSVLSEEDFNTIQFMLYPNPTKDILNVVLPSNIEKAQVEIYSVLGKKVLVSKLNKYFNKIEVSNFNSGIYLIKIITDKAYSVKQFVKK